MARRKVRYFFVLVCITAASAKDPEPELPPCPTNYQFVPNSLPMHCRMVNPPSYPVAPPGPFPPQFPPYFGPIVGKPAESNPAAPKSASPAAIAPVFPPAPPGLPAMPMGMPGMPMGMPGMPMAMPGMPMVGGPPQSKLPVIVMPFYSPDPSYKKTNGQPSRRPKPYKRRIRVIKKSRHHHHDTDSSTDTDSSDTDTDSSDSDRGFWNWKHRRSMSRRKKIKHIKDKQYLTPILQYVSKDGYVIFEKQISKNEAKNWLGDAKNPQEVVQKEEEKKPTPTVNKHERTEEEDEDEPEPVERVKPTNKFKPADSGQKVVVKFSKNPQRSYKKPNEAPERPKSKLRQY